MPVSTSTTPEPAAIAQALQCGTPGKGSGSRSRHRPGTTRSPRPSSRFAAAMARTIVDSLDMAGAEVVKRYFDALAARDLETASGCWRPGGVDRFVGEQTLIGPYQVREYFDGLFAAFPDWQFEVLEMTGDGGNRTAVRWRARATFAGPGPFQGVAPNGAALGPDGRDVV